MLGHSIGVFQLFGLHHRLKLGLIFVRDEFCPEFVLARWGVRVYHWLLLGKLSFQAQNVLGLKVQLEKTRMLLLPDSLGPFRLLLLFGTTIALIGDSFLLLNSVVEVFRIKSVDWV